MGIGQFEDRIRIHDVDLSQPDRVVGTHDRDVERLSGRIAKRIRHDRRVADGDMLTIAQVIKGRGSRGEGQRDRTVGLTSNLGDGVLTRE